MAGSQTYLKGSYQTDIAQLTLGVTSDACRLLSHHSTCMQGGGGGCSKPPQSPISPSSVPLHPCWQKREAEWRGLRCCWGQTPVALGQGAAAAPEEWKEEVRHCGELEVRLRHCRMGETVLKTLWDGMWLRNYGGVGSWETVEGKKVHDTIEGKELAQEELIKGGWTLWEGRRRQCGIEEGLEKCRKGSQTLWEKDKSWHWRN